jgi:DNA-binding CsgD family transcriptional regulator
MLTDDGGRSDGACSTSFPSLLSHDAIAIYKFVVAHPDCDPKDVARALDLSPAQFAAAVDALRASRLLRPATDPAGFCDPVGPERAMVELLAEDEIRIRREQAVLLAIREELLSLQPAYLDGLRRRMPVDAIDVMHGSGSAMSKVLIDHAQRASTDVCAALPGQDIDKIGWIHSLSAASPRWDERSSIRLVLDHLVRQHPLTRKHLALLNEHGDEVRTAHRVPIWLALFDHHTAVVSVGGHHQEGGIAVVRHPAVVESLRAAFEQLWESARPYPTESAAQDEDVRDRLRQEIVRYLAAGLKDEVIARRVGLSVRTCRRHIADIMEHVGATSRFQAGVLVEREMLSASGPDDAHR